MSSWRYFVTLHDHTRFMVFVHNGYSEAWFTDRGLREGCRPSPILFSIFHHCVLFRARRSEHASAVGRTPGLPCACKVDSRLSRPGRAKRFARGVVQAVIGDTEYADDAALIGFLEELKVAEKLFVQALSDWDQQEHPGKREKLVVAVGGRQRMEVFNQFETRAVKHLGSLFCDNADQWRETNRVSVWLSYCHWAPPGAGAPGEVSPAQGY